MALESATYINQLVNSNPSGADPKGQGDDHLRLIKAVLQNTFPGLTGPVTATQAQLNFAADPNNLFKPGMIIMWSGAVATIPAGWALCDGNNGTPWLMDRFIVGAGGNYAPGATGGSVTHGHTGSAANSTVATTVSVDGWGITPNVALGVGPAGRMAVTTGVREVSETLESVIYAGNNQTFTSGPHSHSVTVNPADGRPPYYALAFIMKV